MTTNQRAISITNAPDSSQLELIFDILGKVFPVGRDYFRNRLLQESSYQPETTWYATVDGHIASTIQIFPLQLRVGKTILNVGGIGSVGTDPDFRGMGLAQSILHAQCHWMEENNYDLSMLLAIIHPYYEKLGWKLIPEISYLIERPSYQAPSPQYEIIPFSSEYIDQIQAIYDQNNQTRTYTLVRDHSYWNDLIKWPEWNKTECLLLRHGDKIVAYGLIEKSSVDRAMLYELNYLPEAEAEVIPLFTALCSLRSDCNHIQAKLNTDHKLYSYFQLHAATEVPMEYTMWKITNLNTLLIKLRSELEARLASSSFQDEQLLIDLHIGDVSATLHYCEKVVTILDELPSKPELDVTRLTLTPESFISSLFFGYSSKLEDPHTRSRAESLHAALFPQQQSIFYVTDKF